MTRLVLFLIAVLAMAAGLAWLAERPGIIDFEWEGYRGSLSVFHAVVILALLIAVATVVWTILRQIWTSPAAVGQFLNRRRQQRGLDALSSGMIAVGAGDRSGAVRYALQARKSLPNEPLTHLLRAQAAQLTGDKATARRIFEAMLSSPDTEPLGLRGLYLEALRVKEAEPARQFAERAMRLNPKLTWPVDAMFDIQCKASDWSGALDTLAIAKKHGQVERPIADRRRAVLLTAQAQALEELQAEKALSLALEAHSLAPSLIPAAAIAGRILISRGQTPKAAKILQKTWSRAPHPDLATAYAYARIGDSPRDRVDRVKQLAALAPSSIESPIAVATTAIEAKDYAEARRALTGLTEGRLTQRIATLMARIEDAEHGDKGRVREWLARAVNAPRDPAWTADGIVSERWAAISPVTGTLDAFQWRVPVDDLQTIQGEQLTMRLESLVPLGAPIAAADHATIDAVASERVLPEDSAAIPTERSMPAVNSDPAASTRNTRPGDGAVASVPELKVEVAPQPAPQRASRNSDPTDSADIAAKPSARSTARPAEELPAVVAEPAPADVTVVAALPSPGAVNAATPAPPDASSKTASANTAAEPPGKVDRKSKRKATAPPADVEIFVSPRAPDDPGPEPDDDNELALIRTRPPYVT